MSTEKKFDVDGVLEAPITAWRAWVETAVWLSIHRSDNPNLNHVGERLGS